MTPSTSAQKSKFLNNYQIFFKEFDENSLKTFTGWAAHKVSRHGIEKFSHFPLCFNPLHLSNVLIYSTLYFPGCSVNFETETLLKTLKRRAELIANFAFPYSVLVTSSRNGQCLSESQWGSRFCDHSANIKC